jgi:hypothetical protein
MTTHAIPFAGLEATTWTPIARSRTTARPREWDAEPGQEELYKRVRFGMQPKGELPGVVATARVGVDFVLLFKARRR